MKINIYKILYNRQKIEQKPTQRLTKGKQQKNKTYVSITQVPKRRLLVNSWVLWARLPESWDPKTWDPTPETWDPLAERAQNDVASRQTQNDDVRMDNKMKTNFDKLHFK